MAKSVVQRLDEADATLSRINAEALAEDAAVVALRDEFQDTCLQYGLGEYQRFLCMQVGTHPWNRYTTGLDPAEVQNKGEKFGVSGFSEKECFRACCVERIPGTKGDEYEKENQKVAENSAGLLPPVAKDTLRVFSLTCGHTNGSLRTIECGINKFGPRDFFYNKKGFKVVLDEGMKWFRICWQVEERWPRLIRLCIEVDNIGMSAAKVDSVWQLTFKAHAILHSEEMRDDDGNTDYGKAEALMKRSGFYFDYLLPLLAC